MQRNDCLVVTEFGAAFGAKIILAELEFTLPRNSITVLMGPSGAGKSTLLHSLAGTYMTTPVIDHGDKRFIWIARLRQNTAHRWCSNTRVCWPVRCGRRWRSRCVSA